MTKTLLALTGAIFAITAFAAGPVSAKTDGFWSADANTYIEKRRKPRVKGGSGCDDPGDAIEHPECR
jgi:hypothetical protein